MPAWIFAATWVSDLALRISLARFPNRGMVLCASAWCNSTFGRTQSRPFVDFRIVPNQLNRENKAFMLDTNAFVETK